MTYVVNRQHLGPDENQERPQLPSRTLEQLQDVREDAHRQSLQTQIKQIEAWRRKQN